ncbi:hypothetical protein EHS25_005719 [Saitozyma podzolica]|uniref:Ubiquitin-like protein ATG12 n=1 Tax=Saitozyma podzolica TaxID=1890683 RepID=A0A427XVV9_9TREE|nr:hypothetical protein EHS25_005719 [Saitozyma podzolica]
MTIAAFHYALHRHLKLRDQEKLVAHILNGHIPEGNLTLGDLHTVYGTNRVLLIHYFVDSTSQG